MIKFRLLINQWLAFFTRKLRNNFYLYLSALLTVLVLLDASVFGIGMNMRDRAFDFMVKNRIVVTKADPDIVIVDIDEASLNAMAKEYGRWPWPRQVFGEFVENIEVQQPKAIVFDILFSDADVYNPDSDTYFNDVIASTDNTFFPMLRLSPESDHLSKITPNMIPGVGRIPENTNTPITPMAAKPIAIVLPHFEAAVNSKRLGTHNIYQDIDGIVREYRLWHDESGWRLPSLPLAASNYTGPAPANLPQNMLLNWRGKPFSYQYVSFSDVFTDMASKVKKRAPNEFANKTVIIGSTAPSLFDVKATAMAKAHPGVEILATAIDNLKHDDYLKVWRGKTSYIFMSLLLIWLTAIAMFRNVDRDRVTTVFSSSQVGLLVLSYLGMNFTHVYLDITAPITWAVIYFSVAKIYALANDKVLQRLFANDIELGKKGTTVLLMPIAIENQDLLSEGKLKKIQRLIEQRCHLPAAVQNLKGPQSGIWSLFSDIIIVSWSYHGESEIEVARVKEDSDRLADALKTLLREAGLSSNTHIRYVQHIGSLMLSPGISDLAITDLAITDLAITDHAHGTSTATGSYDLASQWRGLFAQAIIKLDTPS
ncbi:MAG: CHASE2 domain-containing protein [Methylotenera sp.]|nr:CHASE2 domain-containing protein [Methylotenera sp.]